MNAKRLRKIYFIAGILFLSCLIAGLIVYALNQNMNLFYTPTQISTFKAPLHTRIRVGGMVEKGSVQRHEGVAVEFIVTDFNQKIKIHYNGILPDLFREGQGIVAMGKLQSATVLIAEQILAKHDENYMPPEIIRNLGSEKESP